LYTITEVREITRKALICARSRKRKIRGTTTLATCAYAPASGLDNNPTALAALQVKADQAQPRDRCFLYAELVSQMTDLAGQQFNSGDSNA
jgi:hypothetical protein